jgi:hypothetical protein
MAAVPPDLPDTISHCVDDGFSFQSRLFVKLARHRPMESIKFTRQQKTENYIGARHLTPDPVRGPMNW